MARGWPGVGTELVIQTCQTTGTGQDCRVSRMPSELGKKPCTLHLCLCPAGSFLTGSMH